MVLGQCEPPMPLLMPFLVLSNQVSPSCILSCFSHRYHRFLSDYDELSGWMKEKTALINADELPTDVASGEALLARHQQHKVRKIRERMEGLCSILRGPGSFLLHLWHSVLWPQHEIDSYDDRFQSADATGQDLLDGNHEASEEIREMVSCFHTVCDVSMIYSTLLYFIISLWKGERRYLNMLTVCLESTQSSSHMH